MWSRTSGCSISSATWRQRAVDEIRARGVAACLGELQRLSDDGRAVFRVEDPVDELLKHCDDRLVVLPELDAAQARILCLDLLEPAKLLVERADLPPQGLQFPRQPAVQRVSLALQNSRRSAGPPWEG